MPGLCPIIDKDIEIQSGGGTWVTFSGPVRLKLEVPARKLSAPAAEETPSRCRFSRRDIWGGADRGQTDMYWTHDEGFKNTGSLYTSKNVSLRTTVQQLLRTERAGLSPGRISGRK